MTSTTNLFIRFKTQKLIMLSMTIYLKKRILLFIQIKTINSIFKIPDWSLNLTMSLRIRKSPTEPITTPLQMGISLIRSKNHSSPLFNNLKIKIVKPLKNPPTLKILKMFAGNLNKIILPSKLKSPPLNSTPNTSLKSNNNYLYLIIMITTIILILATNTIIKNELTNIINKIIKQVKVPYLQIIVINLTIIKLKN